MKRDPRVHVAEPLTSGASQTLSRAASDHLLNVLRLRVGDRVVLFDGRGGEYVARLASATGRATQVEVGEHVPIERESPVAITLLQCLARGEKMDWIVQKATELGVQRIVPISAERSVVRLDAARSQRRADHWRAIAVGACEQCGRNRVPEIDPVVSFAAACTALPDATVRLLLLPDAARTLRSVDSAARPIAILVGPEGGFDASERTIALDHAFSEVRFGPRVMRTETAAIAAIAALGVLLGDLAQD